ncbi:MULTISPECIES: ASCH domain-containing protein [unclassified Rathayibacter]|uniref:ASCH domain-containing protein n=1 Tax=unclassified Rathayibacter TaxID=2609250 RepID=UPI001FB219DA|nr:MULTISPECIES: ASCH domain-containing protein [unclassified Rathayibacter]MCJ1673224.1 ASCH domain-containing protein [Rathayibacter sp. VKM Ac-2929]MCJ1682723.1 ASCH domain-containing protein [Rathayibacter sp. VKM Ac-2928]
MSTLPGDASVPARLDLPGGAFLRPLVTSDADLLHPVIGQRRGWLAALLPKGDPSGLPSASPGDDLRALRRLETAARERRLFAYLLVGADWTEVLGALSVRPVGDDHGEASWWVVPSLVGSRLEEELDAYARRWLLLRWPFERVETPDNHPEEPAALAGANLLPLLPETPARTPLPEPDPAAAEVLWAAYRAHEPTAPEELPLVESFGDSVELADELLALVRRGVKTATASLVGDEPVLRVGDHWIVCDGAGVARVVLRTVEIRLGPLDSVDDAFAWDEGENDRSRESWLAGHRRYFERESPGGIGTVVFERFRLVWPEEDATVAAGFSRRIASERPDGAP